MRKSTLLLALSGILSIPITFDFVTYKSDPLMALSIGGVVLGLCLSGLLSWYRYG